MSVADEFDQARVAPDTAAYNEAIRAASRHRTWPPLTATQYRADLCERLEQLTGGPPYSSPDASDMDLGGSVRGRVFATPRPRGVYLYFHGGGWCIGGADQQDRALEELARSTRLAVVSVDYRLAPEHPFPAGLDDAEAAARWLLDAGAQRFGTDRFVIGGDSAGANLALSTLLRLRESGDHDRFLAVSLMYGWFDATLTPSVSGINRDGGVLTHKMLEWFADQYLPHGVDRSQPLVSPLRAHLVGLPPALLTVGTNDPLLDDSLFLHARLRAACVPVELNVVPGGGHAFDVAPIAAAARARARVEEFLTAAVSGTVPAVLAAKPVNGI